MFGVTRFDPSSAPTQSVSPTHATPPTASATGIDALKARVAAKKAQRVEPSTAADSEAAAAPTTTQTAASKPKTKAKERYLKKKSGRRKAAHQKAIHGHTLDDLNAREKERQAKAQETPEQKASRKLAAKEAKRARRAEAARQIDKPADGDSQEERKAIKRALKASKLAHNATDQQQQPAPSTDTTTPNPSKQEPKADSNTLQPAAHTDVAPTEPDPQPRKKRKTEESKAQAAAAGIIHKAAKAAKRSQSAVNSTYAAEQQEEEQRQVERLDALPVFQKPAPLQPPDPSLLANLSVARELADALHVDSRSAVGFDQLVDQCVLNAKLTNRLRTLDIQNFFAVQSAVLPLLLAPSARHRRLFPFPLQDLCINAPTGSGKTLSYVIPIIDLLYSRYTKTKAPRRLRALVILPTKDLVQQLKETFDSLIFGTDLKVGTATGHLAFFKEQQKVCMQNGISPVDILIATPGRLMDHLSDTPHFSLEDLEFFVVDEADRLMAQSFDDWLPSVMDELHRASENTSDRSWLNPIPMVPRKRRVQKLLLSATLSRDPIQIAALKLHQPIFVAVSDVDLSSSSSATAVQQEFSLPHTLREHMIVCSSSIKPLMLVHLLQQHQLTHGICFTKSTEAATRLVKLLQFLHEEMPDAKRFKAASFSSELSVPERSKVINQFKLGEISLLVCSDLISRGIDIPNVSHVINYDVPVDLRKYVHRVGRTARAGREGDAWSLVESQEAAFFKALHRQGGRSDKIKRERVPSDKIEPYTEAYERALEKLKEAFTRSQ